MTTFDTLKKKQQAFITEREAHLLHLEMLRKVTGQLANLQQKTNELLDALNDEELFYEVTKQAVQNVKDAIK